ncbi:peptidase family m54 domain-containing protein [Ditylenchus destructor]|nr:peptidase family m54 domain-containing protein [Ditylenchus destructor]
MLGLRTATELIRVRERPSRDGLFQCQLNLDDILDAAISVLPRDAYALLIVVNHDLFEDDDDDFVCGRAYGGSRVAVVSTARYHPLLDVMQGVDREHAWPASHCQAYLKQMCVKEDTRRKKARKIEEEDNLTVSGTSLPLEAALVAHKILPSLVESTTSAIPSSSASISTGLWLSRICRTAAHELGHCFGIDHCVYYACAMQGSASICEDNRQPPYLCPVDLAKVIQATGATIKDRNVALLSFCDRFPEVHLFAAFAAWIRAKESESKNTSEGCSSHKTSQ